MTKRINWLPGLDTLRRYEATWLPHDVVAGLVLATMLVPVGIAYATASGLPGICGLYATILPTRCSAQAASLSWGRIRRWRPLFLVSSLHCPVAIPFAP